MSTVGDFGKGSKVSLSATLFACPLSGAELAESARKWTIWLERRQVNLDNWSSLPILDFQLTHHHNFSRLAPPLASLDNAAPRAGANL